MIIGAQHWVYLSPSHFVDEPSNTNCHEQDRGWVAPNGGNHQAENIAEVRPSRPNEVFNNIGRGQAALKAVDCIPESCAGLCDFLLKLFDGVRHPEALSVRTSLSR